MKPHIETVSNKYYIYNINEHTHETHYLEQNPANNEETAQWAQYKPKSPSLTICTFSTKRHTIASLARQFKKTTYVYLLHMLSYVNPIYAVQ